MTQKELTLLGCSSSILLTLALSNSVQANESPIRELVFTANDTPETVADMAENCGCSGWDSDLLNNDSLGDEAIARYGCDCAGCRFMARQVLNGDISEDTPTIH